MRACTAAISLLLALLAASTACADPVADSLAARCARDARLDSAAARALADPSGFDAQALREEAWTAGLRAPSVYALVLRGGDPVSTGDAVARWLAGHALSPSLSRCAFAVGGDNTAVALAPRVVEVTDAPARDGLRAWRIARPDGATDLALIAVSQRGAVLRARADEAGVASLAITPGEAWTLQAVATFSWGPSPVATWVEGDVLRAPDRDDRFDSWGPRQVYAAVNAMRRDAGVAPLRRDPLLDEIATRHARHLATRGVIAHAPVEGVTPVERLREAGVTAERVAENLARGRTLAEAHQRLARSPSHRANLLDAELDAMGFGVARREGVIYLVELFAARPSLSARGE